MQLVRLIFGSLLGSKDVDWLASPAQAQHQSAQERLRRLAAGHLAAGLLAAGRLAVEPRAPAA